MDRKFLFCEIAYYTFSVELFIRYKDSCYINYLVQDIPEFLRKLLIQKINFLKIFKF